MRRARRAATVLATAVLLLLGGCAQDSGSGVMSGLSVQDEDGLNGARLPRPYDVPDTVLRDTEGRAFDFRSDATRPLTLVFFGYTHCPDVCQAVMADIASALVRLDDEQRSKVDMAFVTTDPPRDTPAVLREYLDRFDPDFRGLTGDIARVKTVGRSFGVEIEKGERLPSGGYDVAHGAQVVGVRPDGTAPYVWTEGTGPAAIAADIEKILAEDTAR